MLVAHVICHVLDDIMSVEEVGEELYELLPSEIGGDDDAVLVDEEV